MVVRKALFYSYPMLFCIVSLQDKFHPDYQKCLQLQGEEVYLKAGDSASFSGNIHHTYMNPLKVKAQGIVTIIEPSPHC